MKKIIIALLGLSISVSAWALDSRSALNTFRHDLNGIRQQLQAGKMKAVQAEILLQAMQVRQNNVLIAQNAEILKRLKHESK